MRDVMTDEVKASTKSKNEKFLVDLSPEIFRRLEEKRNGIARNKIVKALIYMWLDDEIKIDVQYLLLAKIRNIDERIKTTKITTETIPLEDSGFEVTDEQNTDKKPDSTSDF